MELILDAQMPGIIKLAIWILRANTAVMNSDNLCSKTATSNLIKHLKVYMYLYLYLYLTCQ